MARVEEEAAGGAKRLSLSAEYLGNNGANTVLTLPIVQPEPYADTVLDTTATTATITLGGSVDTVIDTLGDHDWYAVTLTAGQRYVFTTQAIAGSQTDSFLTLRDAASAALTSDDDGGDSRYSLIAYTPAATGTYYLDVGTFSDLSTGSFRLLAVALPTVGADNVLGSTGTTGTLALGGIVGGNIETVGDRDWYRITLVAGESYVFRTGAIVANGTVDTTLTVRDVGGTQLVTNDDAGEGRYSALRFTAPTSGTYYLDVGGSGTATGQYTLSAFTTPAIPVYTNDQIANQLTDGYWGGPAQRHAFNVAPGGTLTFNVTGLTAAGQTLAREALNLWTDVTGIIFQEVTVAAQITFDDNEPDSFANANYANGVTTSGTVNVGTNFLALNGTSLNSLSFQAYIHEIGHVLGLGHPGNYNADAVYAVDALYQNDSWATTVMSYFSQINNTYFASQGFTRQFTVSPMVADGIAITVLYGANTLTRTGDTIYGFNNTSGRAIYNAAANPRVGYTVFDNGGIDTLDYSGFGQNQRINLNPETFSNVGGQVGNVSIARGTVIENAIGGSGDDVIIGNSANNTLTGNSGGDTLDGGAGDDTLIGGPGSDIYIVDSLLDVVTELLNQGDDEVRTALSAYALPVNVERLTYTGTANASLSGNSADNVIFGSVGADRFDLSQGGNDTVDGGDGDDGFFFGAAFTAADRVDGGNGTNDQIGLQGNYAGANALTLGLSTLSRVEVISVLPGFSYDITLNNANTPAGQRLSIFGTSLGPTDNLTVNASAETDGTVRIYGGLGVDTLTGGRGNDGFYFGPGRFGPSDRVIGGIGNNDQIALDGDYTITVDDRFGVEVVVLLRSPSGPENNFNITVSDSFVPTGETRTIFGTSVTNAVVIDGSAETDGILTLYGGTAADTITGGRGGDWIFGGNGGDTLRGGSGADIFFYDNAAQSSSTNYDRLVDFDFANDRIRISDQVFQSYAFVTGGALSTATFDANLAAATNGLLTRGRSVLFTPDSGTLSGQTFLVVDNNGVAGYQAGEDYVFLLPNADTGGANFIIA